MGGGGCCLLIIIPPSDHPALTGEPYYPAARSNRGVTQRLPVSYREFCEKFLLVSLGTNSYLLIRYMSSKLQTNGKKTSPVITLQMLGFFRIY